LMAGYDWKQQRDKPSEYFCTQMLYSFDWKTMAESTVGWFIVREKYYSLTKKNMAYKPSKHDKKCFDFYILLNCSNSIYLSIYLFHSKVVIRESFD